MDFNTFGLHPRVLDGVKSMGFTNPTPIQSQAIPHALEKRDLIGLAQTGTGKTAAFALPILHHLLDNPKRGVRALIIAPTRELAEQINGAVASFGRKTGLKTACLYGGINIRLQIKKLRHGLDIVVACPGRLLDHLGRKTIDLSGVEILVLDEADRMFDMGFLPDVRRIVGHLPTSRQTLLFSATMPDDVRKLTSEILQNPVMAQVGFLRPAVTVSHALYPVSNHLKTALLLELLQFSDTKSVLVFTRTKHRAKRVAQQLERAGHRATCLQGNLSQNQRQAALNGFRKGSFKILVATDIASRGIDVTQISHVINYDMPDTVDAYTHRIGRTGRLTRTGDAYTLSTGNDIAMVRTIEKTLGQSLERRRLSGFNYGAPASEKNLSSPNRPNPRTAKPAVKNNRQSRNGHRRKNRQSAGMVPRLQERVSA